MHMYTMISASITAALLLLTSTSLFNVVSGNSDAVASHLIVIEQAIGSSQHFREGWRLRVEPSDATKWKVRTDKTADILADEVAALEAAVQSGGLYYLRTHVNSSDVSSPYVYASTKMCLLAAVEFRPDIFFSLDASGAVRSMDIRLPAGSPSSCSNSKTNNNNNYKRNSKQHQQPSSHIHIPVAGLPFQARFGIVPTEEAYLIPVQTGAKGMPLPGQRELAPQDVAAASASVGSSGGGVKLDAEAAALLASAEGTGAAGKEGEANKGWWSGYWPYILGGWVLMQLLGLGGGGAAAAEGGGAARRPAAAAAAQRARQ